MRVPVRNRKSPFRHFDERADVRYMFSMRTRGEQLTYAVAYSLRRIRLPNRRTLSETERYQIAKAVVDKLREHGDIWRLDEELPPFFHGPSTQGYR